MTPLGVLAPVRALVILGAACLPGVLGCARATPSTSPVVTRAGQRCSLGAPDGRAIAVDLDALLADPDRYDGARVRLRAFMMNEKEDQGLYRTEREAARPPDARRLARCKEPSPITPIRALWWEAAQQVPGCNRREVTVEGTFDACERGHMALFAGGLQDVRFVAESGE